MPGPGQTEDVSLRTAACDLLGIRHPVVLGGMAKHSSAELVAAVSNAGGLGILGGWAMSPDEILAQVAAIRALTSAPFGLNLVLFKEKMQEQQDTMIAQRVPVASFAWASPNQPLTDLFARVHDAGSKVMHMVSTGREACRAAEAGADLIVAQGTEAGGHVGLMTTFALVPMVVDAVAPIPVLAAGGIADGRGLAAALALGASGAVVGTRFLATVECPIHPHVKQAVLDSDGHDTDITEIPDLLRGHVFPGATPRVLRNAFIREWAGREWELRERRTMLVEENDAARLRGDVAHGTIFFGQGAGIVRSIRPAAEVVVDMVREAREILARLAAAS